MELTRKPLITLIEKKYNFFIPDYQRGYKWTRDEVLKLLNDIWEFALNNNKGDNDFYCLQPVVVKPEEGKYYVIDGQQRLTTLLIFQQAILDYKTLSNPIFGDLIDKIKELNERFNAAISNTYSIEYQTREKSNKWLLLRNNEAVMQENSDYYHIYMAYKATMEFLKWIDGNTPDDLKLDDKLCPK